MLELFYSNLFTIRKEEKRRNLILIAWKIFVHTQSPLFAAKCTVNIRYGAVIDFIVSSYTQKSTNNQQYAQHAIEIRKIIELFAILELLYKYSHYNTCPVLYLLLYYFFLPSFSFVGSLLDAFRLDFCLTAIQLT